MDERFVNARSPLRLLEKGLHGGLGKGNLGVVIAGHGVGKTPFLVGVALDELLRGGYVLHVSTENTVAHVRAYYDTVFEDLASTMHLDDEAVAHAEVDRRRSIRVYNPDALTPGRLREAVKLETEASTKPSLLVLEGPDLANTAREDLADLKALAGELEAEVWISAASDGESISRIPDWVAPIDDLVSVIVALEPGDGVVALRALKDHDSPDIEALHVALDPRTLLLTRS